MEETGTGASLLAGSAHTAARVKDFNKLLWDVREVRPTKYGFNLCFGTPRATYNVPYRGSVQLIVTKALRDYWYSNRTKRHRFFLDLPATSSALKTALKRLRLNHREDVRAFWTERVDDLAALPVRDFAAKHNVEPALAFQWRKKLVRGQARANDWWHTPEVLKVLFSPMSLGEAGRELGIAISDVNRLRRLAKQVPQPSPVSSSFA